MRRLAAFAALLAMLVFAGQQAFAFQEMPAPPPVDDSGGASHASKDGANRAPPADPLNLGTSQAAETAKSEQGGLRLFGYTLMPNLNFGLDVLYGQDAQQRELQLQGKDQNLSLENGDVSVLGKVKRRF